MSQKKVDQYKESKKTRKEDVKKQKTAKKINAVIGWVILILVIAALVVGLIFTFKNCQPETGDGYTVTEQVISDIADIEGTSSEEETSTEAPSTGTEAEEGSEEASGEEAESK
ncbi:MAG: hypothetical protein IK088_06005 [Lachnospiraceae bacterium]|nr:hypothetical protein [Lachnospiraceae bacterium]